MKKRVKQYVHQTQAGGQDHYQVLKEFSRMLDDQVCEITLHICICLSLIQHSEYEYVSVFVLHGPNILNYDCPFVYVFLINWAVEVDRRGTHLLVSGWGSVYIVQCL